jgi:26S proteasome regulatory subunit N10
MALEATLILLDNSAFALNGDYLPTRWESQVDSAGLLIQSKL